MLKLERAIAEGSGQGSYISSGIFGKVYAHGPNRVYKIASLDGTAVWLERCFAVQKRLGIDHPLCEFMPEIFSLSINKVIGRYEVVMAKYTCIPRNSPAYNSVPAGFRQLSGEAEATYHRLSRKVFAVIGEYGNDLHAGNILLCYKTRRWVVTDPSADCYNDVKDNSTLSPEFARAKRVATQYGPQRRH